MFVRDTRLRDRLGKLNSVREAPLSGLSKVPLIEDFGESACADPRDQVYRLLGISKDSKRAPFSINYSQDVVSLVFDMLEYCGPSITFAHSLFRILCLDELVYAGKRGRWISWPLGLRLNTTMFSEATIFSNASVYRRVDPIGSWSAKVPKINQSVENSA